MLIVLIATAALATETDPVCPGLSLPHGAELACDCLWDTVDWWPSDRTGLDPTGTCYEYTNVVTSITHNTARQRALNRLNSRELHESCKAELIFDYENIGPLGAPNIESQVLYSMDDGCGTDDAWIGWQQQGNKLMLVDWLGAPIVRVNTQGRVPHFVGWIDDDDNGEMELFIAFVDHTAWKAEGPFAPWITIQPPPQ